MRKGFFILVILSFVLDPVLAQGILNRVVNRSLKKVENKVEDMLVEKASEAIARKIYHSLSQAFDDVFKEAYKQDSIYRANGGDSLAARYAELAGSWMERMNEMADVPESYEFDLELEVDIRDGQNQANKSRWFFSKNQPAFAIEQKEKNEIRIFLVDTERDLVILYTIHPSGEKTGQALPGFLGLGSALLASVPDSLKTSWSVEATGKSKTIAGYHAQEFRSSDEEYESLFFLSKDLPVSWRKTYAGAVDRFSGSYWSQWDEIPEGFIMESHLVKKGNTKDQSSWIVTSVSQKTMEIVNEEYTFPKAGE